MASFGKSSKDQTLSTKHIRRPSKMLLKDYLRDDLSSCSSSGFKSFPRRQCCTTVRFDVLEKDLQAERKRLLRAGTSKPRPFCSFKAASSTKSALHRASRAVINAVKLLQFPSVSDTRSSKTKHKRGFLFKTLSRKVLIWRKAVDHNKEDGSHHNGRWRSFREFLEEGNNIKTTSNQNTGGSSIISMTLGSSSGSSGKSNENSWGESEFRWEILRSPSGSSAESDVVARKESTLLHKAAANAGDGEDSTGASTCTLDKAMDWASEEKEQFSPVSVLDCPFQDDEDINCPSDSTCSCVEGSKHKHMHKNRHLDRKASLQPVKLEKLMALSEEDEPIAVDKEKSKEDGKAWRLVNEVKSSTAYEAEKKLLLDFFKQSSEESGENYAEKEGQVSKAAEDWMSGELKGVKLGRELYVEETDKCWRWRNISEEGGKQVGIELEFEVLTALVNELVLELTS